MRKKKQDIDAINKEFQEEIRNGAERLYNYMTDFIDNRLDNIDEKFHKIIMQEINHYSIGGAYGLHSRKAWQVCHKFL